MSSTTTPPPCQKSERNSDSRSSDDDDAPRDQHAAEVEEWALRIPIGLGLCPWAGKSHNSGALRVVTCEGTSPAEVAKTMRREISVYADADEGRGGERGAKRASRLPPWSTTLVVCPHVAPWNDDFAPFDAFVQADLRHHLLDALATSTSTSSSGENDILEHVTLVAFHPRFLRWYDLPQDADVGSTVLAHHGYLGQKSSEAMLATIVEVNNPAFGKRKVKVRFHDSEEEDVVSSPTGGDGSNKGRNPRREQFIPTDWIVDVVADRDEEGEGERSTATLSPRPQPPPRPSLPDNVMHRSPHPTIHIIRNTDLTSMALRDVSRVKRKNARRMAKLGWKGAQERVMYATADKSAGKASARG